MHQTLTKATATRPQNAILLIDHLSQRPDAIPSKKDAALVRLLKKISVGELIDVSDKLKTRDGDPRFTALYELWIELSDGKSPQLFAAWYNLGVQYVASGVPTKAIVCFKNAKLLKADLYQAGLNIGTTYEMQGYPASAVDAWTDMLQTDQARTILLNNRGRVLENLKRFDEAERDFLASLLTDPRQPDVLHHFIGMRSKTCSWPVFRPDIPGLTRDDYVKETRALAALAMFDDVALHDDANERWVAEKYPHAPARLSPANGYGHKKIRIGYMSSDFCVHPMAFLVTELFEQHDRERFEVYGYCSTSHEGGAVRERLLASFDTWRSILGMKDEEAARLIRADEIDILIDLNGLTMGTRIPVMRWRPAPVQVTYLGYNGPIPLPELDYILADEVVIPPSRSHEHRPKPLYLPQCYQANDAKLPVAPKETRQEVGLPDDTFVYCCFSTNYKITEEMFDAWMAILQRTENAVLWLYADNQWSHENLKARAARHGIVEDRLIFASRVEPAKYRSRLALADLFLDTYPYNAGTTASDALRVGLPLITLCGESFVSRMATSLLRTIGLDELITHSLSDYIALAVDLASDKPRYEGLRGMISGDAWARTLGNTPAFTKGLEAAYASVAVNCASGP